MYNELRSLFPSQMTLPLMDRCNGVSQHVHEKRSIGAAAVCRLRAATMSQTPSKRPSFSPDDVQSAQDYIDKVKEYFPEELETYQEFKAILQATCDHK